MTAANRVAEIFDAPRELDDGPLDQTPRGGRLELVDGRLPLSRGTHGRHRGGSSRAVGAAAT